MLVKISLVVIILLSLLFLSFSFKLVFYKKQHLPKTADDISSALADYENEKTDIMPDRKQNAD